MAGSNWKSVPGFDRESEKYVTLDLDAWIKQNGIREEGERQGKLDQPPSDADGLDETESNILAWVNHRADTCRTDVTNHLVDLARDLATNDIDENLAPKAKYIAAQAGRATLEIDDVFSRHRAQLARSRISVMRAVRDMREFRDRAKLGNRDPDYEQRRSALWVILGCFIIEVALNASLLMEVNAFGLVGAAFQMALISAVNIFIFGFAMGELLRRTHHVSPGRKAVAALAMVLLVPLVVVFNLAVGHFRDSMEAILTDPTADVFAVGTDALVRFANSPFGLDSFQSAMLAFVGFLFYCVASWKWLGRDDVYPEYGSRHRRFTTVLDEYDTVCTKARKDLTDTYGRLQSHLDDEYHQMRLISPKAFEVRARAKNIVTDFTTHLNQYNHHVNFLMAAYRTANRNVRTEPWPPHFDTSERIDEALLKPPSFAPPPEADLTQVFDSLDAATSTLQRKYEEASQGIPTLDKLLHPEEAERSITPPPTNGVLEHGGSRRSG